MPSELASRFMQTLQEAEISGEVDRLADLFEDGAELRQVTGAKRTWGRDGARRFWQEYLSLFEYIRSTFTRVVEDDSAIVLEWISEAEGPHPGVIRYEGITVLEHKAGRIARFRTYFDSARFAGLGQGRE